MAKIINKSVCRGVAGRRQGKVKGVVIHNDAGSKYATAESYVNALGRMNNNQLANGFAHYYIDRNTVARVEDTYNQAWHTANTDGNANYIGYEVCQSVGASDADFIANEQETFRQVAEDMKYYNLPVNRNTVRLHKEFSPTACPHRSWELHGKNLNAVKDYFISQINKYIKGGQVNEPVDNNKILYITKESFLNQVVNVNGKINNGEYLTAIINDIPDEKMAKSMVLFIQEHTVDLFTNCNVFLIEYPNRLMLKIVGVTNKEAADIKKEVLRITRGQFSKYEEKNIKIVPEGNGKLSWIEIDNMPKDWQAVSNRLRGNLRHKFYPIFLKNRIAYKKQANGKICVEVINIENTTRAKEVCTRLRRWFPGGNNPYTNAAAKLQF